VSDIVERVDVPHLNLSSNEASLRRLSGNEPSLPSLERDISGLDASIAWPPAPHDPRERTLISELLAQSSGAVSPAPHGSSGRASTRTTRWEVRAFPVGGRMHRYFAPRGLLHLQLWQPESGVSVLTPSRLTLGRWEVFPVDGWKHPAERVEEMRRVVRRAHRVELPSVAQLGAVRAWFVAREERRALSEHQPAGSESPRG